MSANTSSPNKPPQSSAVSVWHATSSSSQPGPIEQCCQGWLDESEIERAQRFRVLTSRNQNIVGRGMARRLLSRDQQDPREIQFELEPHGKPFVTVPSSAKRPFNVAHTDGLVLCGVGSSSHQLVGVDVERLGRRTDPELATRFFSQPEVTYLQRYRDPNDRRDAFLRIWTLKESFIKAIGTGLQTPLADFAFEDIDSDCPQIRMLSAKLESDLTWKFFCIQPRYGFVGAVAVASHSEMEAPRIDLHSFDDLVEQTALPDQERGDGSTSTGAVG